MDMQALDVLFLKIRIYFCFVPLFAPVFSLRVFQCVNTGAMFFVTHTA